MRFKKNGAENGTRTRNILLGRQVLYQLSYLRLVRFIKPKTHGFGNPLAVQQHPPINPIG
jgi:hypothetical protein